MSEIADLAVIQQLHYWCLCCFCHPGKTLVLQGLHQSMDSSLESHASVRVSVRPSPWD